MAASGIGLLLEPLQPAVKAAFTNPEILIGTGFYLVLKPILRNSGLVDTKKGAYKTSMIMYNIVMALFSAACFVMTTVALGWDRGYGAALLRWAGDSPVPLYTDSCPSPVFSSNLFTYAAWAFYYSKYVEYLDTAWLVLKGKVSGEGPHQRRQQPATPTAGLFSFGAGHTKQAPGSWLFFGGASPCCCG